MVFDYSESWYPHVLVDDPLFVSSLQSIHRRFVDRCLRDVRSRVHFQDEFSFLYPQLWYYSPIILETTPKYISYCLKVNKKTV